MAYRGLPIIFASFLLFLGHCGYSNGACADGECAASDLGTSRHLELNPPANDQDCYSDAVSVGLSCETGTVDGPSENTCKSGTWEQSQTNCNVFCSPPNVENLILTPNKTRYSQEETVTFSCNMGYKLTPPRSAQCTDTGSLNPPQEPGCTAFDCSAPSSMDDNLDWTDKGNETYRGDQTIEYSCPKGFKIEGVNNNTCIDEDEWANDDPTCTAFNCSAPSSKDKHLNWTGKGNETYNGDQTIEYSCHKGFKLEGVNNNTCIDEDGWANEDPTCTAFNCSAPSSTDKHLNWTDKSNETYNGDQTIEYSCAEGFELKGSKTNTCTDQNEWKNEDPTCNSGNVVQVFWYFFLITTFYSIFSFYM